MSAQQIISNRSLRLEYSSLTLATGVRDRMTGHVIVLGDNDRFWLLPNRYASILHHAGYDYAA